MNVIFIGQFTDASGYGEAARGYLKSLVYHITENNLNVNLATHTVQMERENRDNYDQETANLLEKRDIKYLSDLEYEKLLKDNDYVLIVFQPLPYFELHKEYIDPRVKFMPQHHVTNQLIKNANKIISAACWETDKFPDLWKEVWNKNTIARMIVPSTFNEKIFSKTIECSLVPYLIEKIETDKKVEKQRDTFTILSLFHWGYRKAPEKLLLAYNMEFRNHDDVQLLIKAYGSVTPGSKSLQEQEVGLRNVINETINSIPGAGDAYPHVLLTCDMMSPERIHELYRDVDLFALVSRGEGFGLPIAEALINKIPVLVSKEGGHTDFVDPQAAFFVEGIWEPCLHAPPGTGYHYTQNLFEPRISSMRKQFRNAYNLWKSGKLSAKGKKGYNYIKKSGYDRAAVGKKLVDILKKEYETINT